MFLVFPCGALAEAEEALYRAGSRRPVSRDAIPPSVRILSDDGRNLLIQPGSAADLAALSALGFQLRRLPDVPMKMAVPKQALLRADGALMTSNAFVAAMVANVQRTNLYAMISELSGETPVMAGGVFTNIATRNTYETQSVDRALDYAGSRLRALGLDVQYRDWSVAGDVASSNLVAERIGTSAPSEIVIVCGHIDSMPNGPLAPGADDNASGAMGVLTAARAMQNHTFERTIRYVLFTGEEQGLLGSAAYAAAIQTEGDYVVGVFNLDMLAYDSNSDGRFILHTRTTNNPGYEADFALASIFTNVAALYPLDTGLNPEIHADGEEYSDHYPFWQNGFPAVFAIEDWIDDVTPYYHTTNDVIGTLNFPYYTAFVQATVAAAAHSAGPVGELSNAEKVSNAVHAVRIELEAVLGKSVPSLSLCLQTSNELFFASSSESPELALTTNMTFRFASNTKNFTATAVLDMMERGWLDIADPITNTIPGYAEPYIPTGTNWAIPNKDEITIRQLLRHSAGVYDVDNDPVPGCGGESYTSWMMAQDPAHQFTVEEMVAQNAVYQLSYFAPDEGYHYSNTGFALLAEIVGRVYSLHSGTNKTLTDYLTDYVTGGLSPVNLPRIRFPNLATDTALPEPYMPGTIYAPSNITMVVSNMNMSAQVGEGNGYGGIVDMNRFIRSVMTGSNVLDENFVRLMQTNTSPYNTDYALGCTYATDLGFGHNGARVGNLSLMSYNPEQDVSVVVYLPLWDLREGMVSFMPCFNALYDAARAALQSLGCTITPRLADGTATHLTLSAGITNVFEFSALRDTYYGIYFSNRTADVRLEVAPSVHPESVTVFTNALGWVCPIAGTYRLLVSADANSTCAMRFYTLTNAIAQATAMITNMMSACDVPACGVVLVDENHVVWVDGFGLADPLTGRAADADTVYGVASVSKTFGAAAIMQMVEHYGLDLDASVTNAVAEFSIRQRFTNNVITPRTILTHHSGIPGDMLNGDYTFVPDTDYRARLLEELAYEYTCQPTNFSWAYNNAGFTLLGSIVENLSGIPFMEYMQSNVLAVCGMTNSSFDMTWPAFSNRMARPWIGTNEYGIRSGAYPWEYCNAEIAGGLFSTPRDMGRYLKMMLADGLGENGRVMSTDSVAEMMTQQDVGWPLDIYEQGLCWVLSDPQWDMDYAGKLAWHDGSSAFYNGKAQVLFDQGLAGYVVCNSTLNGDLPAAALQVLLQAAVEDKTGIPVPSPYEPPFSPITNLPPEQINLVTGLYAGQGYTITVRPAETGIQFETWTPDGSSSQNLVARENGMFSATNSQMVQYYFTNVQDHFVMMLDMASGAETINCPRGDRVAQAGCSAAWSNRFGAWLNVSLLPIDYTHYAPDELASVSRGMNLFVEEHALMAEVSCSAFGRLILEPGNDEVVFSQGFGRSMGCAIQVFNTNGYDHLR
ncbi:MAG: M20/M25/M40 family metallo-hydrolase, partial [Kiritimatiellae bacterium]|nr:M20/M25/M40 family metallo-hydrolase [Kiritimatiellia bacterium]